MIVVLCNLVLILPTIDLCLSCIVHFLMSVSHFLSVFKPEELRQALMPTLEALYRQDPESLPFRQPVDPQLLGIPVRIRTSNKSNLVRDCTGWHFDLSLKRSWILFLFPPFYYCICIAWQKKRFSFSCVCKSKQWLASIYLCCDDTAVTYLAE